MNKPASWLLSAMLVVCGLMAQGAPLAPEARHGKATSLPVVSLPVNEGEIPAVLPGQMQPRPVASLPNLSATPSPQPLCTRRPAIAGQRAVAQTVELMGQGWTGTDIEMAALYKMPHNNSQALEKVAKLSYTLNYGAHYDAATNTLRGVASQVLYGQTTFMYLLSYDLDTYEETSRLEVEIDMLAIGAAWDETEGKMYGYFYNGATSDVVWGVADYTAVTRQKIKDANIEELCQAVIADNDGNYYGIEVLTGNLVSIDKATGTHTLIGATAVPTNFSPGYCYNPRNHTMLVSAVANDQSATSLYEVDLATGATSVCATYPTAQIYNMFILAAKADDKAPDAPQITASAPGGSHRVDVTLTMPSTLFDGTPTSGNLTWNVGVGDDTLATGTAAAGATVNTTVTIDATAQLTLWATASNATGASPRAEYPIFVGNGIPATPANVVASHSARTMTISWDAVTTSADGGYIDPQAVRYTLSLGNDILADNLTATQYGYTVEIPADRTDYRYSVVASFDGRTGAAAQSNTVGLGSYHAPYTFILDNEGAVEQYGFTTLDANNDGRCWAYDEYTYGVTNKYNNDIPADDWLFSPAIALEGGKTYTMEFDVASENVDYSEKIEVKAGTAPTPAGMTISVLPVTEVKIDRKYDGYKTLTASLLIPADGDYHIGAHAVSDAGMYKLSLQRIYLGKGLGASTPQTPADVTFNPGVSGQLTLNGSVTLPTKDINDRDLSGEIAAKITRKATASDDAEVEVATITGAPGAAVTFTDEVPALGSYIYKVSAGKDGDFGEPLSREVKFFIHTPVVPGYAVAWELDGDYGTVTVEWEEVTKTTDGLEILPGNVTYMLYSLSYNDDKEEILTPLLDNPLSATDVTFRAIGDASKQAFFRYAVKAFNNGVECEGRALSDLITVGTPYHLPMEISGPDDLADYIIGFDDAGGAPFAIYSTDELEIPACGSDEYVFGSCAQYLYRTGDLFTGKVSLKGAERPQLSFYTFKAWPEDLNTVEVFVTADGVRHQVATFDHDLMPEFMWTRCRVDLSAYIGKDVEILFRTTVLGNAYTLLDLISVNETAARDAAALWVSAPSRIEPDTPFEVRGAVANQGYETLPVVEARLLRDGQVVATKQLENVAAGATVNVTFTQSISRFDSNNAKCIYTLEAVAEGDTEAANDLSAGVTVVRPLSELPAVTDLSVERTAEGNRLTWTPYSTDNLVPVEQTDDFEDGESYAWEYRDWTFLDQDVSGCAPNITIPGVEAFRSVTSFLVFDTHCVEESKMAKFSAHSGDKYLMAINCGPGVECADWAFSPRLSGDAQTVSFYSRSYSGFAREACTILYTTEDSVDPDDYTLLGVVTDIPTDWTRYEFTLPAGALHFAIVYREEDKFYLVIDDVTYTPDPLNNAVTLIGYDIYRDGVKVNAKPVADGRYLDTAADDADHTYHLISLYREGESELSNAALITAAALETLTAEALSITAEAGAIVIRGNPADLAVSIANAAGQTILAARGNLRHSVAPGVYLVTVGATTAKLLVK